MTALIDTCVIVDALQDREPFAGDAQTIFLLVANRRFAGYITAKSVADIYYLTHKVLHSDGETRKVMSKLLSLFCVIDTTDADCRKALSSGISDYEDAIMAESAIRSEMDCIVTRNIGDYKKSGITVVTPEAFLKGLAEDRNDPDDDR